MPRPIARWTTVDRQRLNNGDTLDLGVVAFAKDGINRVEFTFAGKTVKVYGMTTNSQTGVYEYHTVVNASDYTSDGAKTITAKAICNGGHENPPPEGGATGLPALTIYANNGGSLTTKTAWADYAAGSDSTGEVGNSSKPYKTIGAALAAVAAANGGKADGCFVKLKKGSHTIKPASGTFQRVYCANEWATITLDDTDETADKDNTLINARYGDGVVTAYTQFKGITLQASGGANSYVITGFTGADSVWVNDCKCVGGGQGNAKSNPLNAGGTVYWTETTVDDCDRAAHSAQMQRNFTVTDISDDVAVLCPLLVNVAVDGVDPLATGAHADVWQWYDGGPTDAILYNVTALDCHYQGIFFRQQDTNYKYPSIAPPFQGVAFVNVHIELKDPVYSGGGASWIKGSGDHLLVWNCTLRTDDVAEQKCGFARDGWDGTGYYAQYVTNVSVRGSWFDRYIENPVSCAVPNAVSGLSYSVIDWGGDDQSNFVANHYHHERNSGSGESAYYTWAPGLDTSNDNDGTVASLDADGTINTTNGAFLIDRLDAVVPVDAAGSLRGNRADIGALEESTAGSSYNISSAVSRRTHGGAGDFDVDLIDPIGSYPVPVECRQGGPTKIIVTFDGNISGSGGLDVSDVLVMDSVKGQTVPSSVSINGAVLTINLSGVADKSHVTVTFPGILDALEDPISDHNVVAFDCRVGDVDGDGDVDIFDMVAVRNELDEDVDSENYRCDINADGSIDLFDQVLARNHAD